MIFTRTLHRQIDSDSFTRIHTLHRLVVIDGPPIPSRREPIMLDHSGRSALRLELQ
jgi:hypothetical protein